MTSPQTPSSSSTAPAVGQNTDIDVEAGTDPKQKTAVPGVGEIEPTLTTDEDAQRDDLPVQPGNS